MSWEQGNQKYEKPRDVNARLLGVDQFDSDEESKIAFCDFLKHNLYFATKFITGVELYHFQEIIMKGCFDRDYFLNILSRGAGKCATPESKVLSNKGMIEIQDVEVGDMVWAKTKPCKVLGKLENPVEPILKLTSTKGYSISGKYDHRILRYNEKTADFDWEYIKNLNVGDSIPIKKGMNFWGSESLFEGFKFEVREKERPLNIDEDLDLFYFLGLILGDGCVRNQWQDNLCAFTTADEETLDFVVNYLKKICPDSSVQVSERNDNKSKEVRIYSKNLVRFLKFIGFSTSAYAHQKNFPKKILKCNGEKVSSFLRGLFDTDGYFYITENKKKKSERGYLGYSSSSFDLIKNLQSILLNFDIPSSIRCCHEGGEYEIMEYMSNTQKSYELMIGGMDNMVQFNNKIGSSIQRKSEKLQYIIDRRGDRPDYGSNIVPNLGVYLKNKYGKGGLKKNGLQYRIHSHVSLQRVKFLLDNDFLDEEDQIKFREIYEGGFIFEQIKDIEAKQDITIDIQVEDEKCYWSDGFINHNTFIIGLFIGLYAIMNPGVKIIILSLSFRQSRAILQELEKQSNKRKALFLKRCIKKSTRGTDMWRMEFTNGSEAIAIPIASGDKIRGFRAQVVVCDEFLSFDEKMVNEVIRPFLSTNANTKQRTDIYELESNLIKQGKIKEKDRTIFPNNKFIALSSASYRFQYMYKVYTNYLKAIDEGGKAASYGVSQLSYLSMPEGFFDASFIEESKASMSIAQFGRELGAQFSDDSSGYFKMSSLIACSIPFGEPPYFEIIGDPGAEYILGIDPSFGESETSDHFAMTLIRLDQGKHTGMVVHSYALAGGTFKNHFLYFTYLLKNFNVVYVITDSTAGGNDFIRGYQESSLYKEEKMCIDLFEARFKDDDWEESVRESKKSYSKSSGKIYHSQNFIGWVQKANVELQKNIDHKKILFAGSPMDDAFDNMVKQCQSLPVEEMTFMEKQTNSDLDKNTKATDFVERQSNLIDLTKKECAVVEVTISPNGNQTFDLPAHLRRDKSPNKARKDNYSSLLLCNWAMKCHFAMQERPDENFSSFVPEAID